MPSNSSDELTAEEVEMVVAILQQTFLTNYMIISAFVVVAYDFLLTASREMDFVWRAKLTGGTAVYVGNRYCLFASISIFLLITMAQQTEQRCNVGLVIAAICGLIATISQAAFVCLRLYAIWNHNWILAAGIFIVYCTPIIVGVARAPWGHNAVITGIPGCFVRDPPSALSFLLFKRALTLALDASILLLTWLKTYRIWKEARAANIEAPVSSLLLRDGTLHFGFLSVLSVVDIAWASSASEFGGSDLLTTFVDIVRSITVSHFILHLRAVYLDSSDDGNRLQSSWRHFASSVAGNLGAPLEFAHDSSEAEYLEGDPSQLEMSRDPLTSGIFPREHNDISEGERLLPKRKAAPTVKMGDIFDDALYGERIMAVIHGKDAAVDFNET